MTDTFCAQHPDVPAESTIMFEGGGTMDVCIPCRDDIMNARSGGWVCKFCSVPIISSTDFRAIKGNHKNGCVRRMET